MLFKSVFIQLRRSAFIAVVKEGKLSPPLDKGRYSTGRLTLSLVFFDRKVNSLLWVCCIIVSGNESMGQYNIAEANLEILQA